MGYAYSELFERLDLAFDLLRVTIMKTVLTMCFALLLSGCATLSQLSTYSISDAELEQALDNQLAKLQSNANIGGIPLTLKVDDMSVAIGPEGRDVVQLGTQATANISVFGFQYPAKLKLELEGTPYYDSEKKAIFVRSLTLLDSTIDAGGYKGNLAPLSNEVMMLMNGYLASNPVYTLDTSNDVVRLLSSVPLNMTIEQGKLALQPRQQ